MARGGSVIPRRGLGRSLHEASGARLICVYHGLGSGRERQPALPTQARAIVPAHRWEVLPDPKESA